MIQQKVSKSDNDEAVTREMKSILNKLTVEKFDTLSKKLLECGIESKKHVETLMREVFEKATTQHHFIEMYTDLCLKLNEFLIEKNGGEEEGGDGGVSFKRILLNQCQDSFLTYLKPPTGLNELTGDEHFE